jgi:hypothetical protein
MTAESKLIERLLIKRATEGLTEPERSELERLLQRGTFPDSEAFERIAAAIHVSRVNARARLPDALRQKLEQQGRDYLASKNH